MYVTSSDPDALSRVSDSIDTVRGLTSGCADES